MLRWVSGSTSNGLKLVVVKQFTCDDGSGSFLIVLRIKLTFEPFTDTFSWRFAGGSGAYEDVTGFGRGTGVPAASEGLLDTFTGVRAGADE